MSICVNCALTDKSRPTNLLSSAAGRAQQHLQNASEFCRGFPRRRSDCPIAAAMARSASQACPTDQHRLHVYLAQWGPRPRGKHSFRSCTWACFPELLAGQFSGTRNVHVHNFVSPEMRADNTTKANNTCQNILWRICGHFAENRRLSNPVWQSVTYTRFAGAERRREYRGSPVPRWSPPVPIYIYIYIYIYKKKEREKEREREVEDFLDAAQVVEDTVGEICLRKSSMSASVDFRRPQRGESYMRGPL